MEFLFIFLIRLSISNQYTHPQAKNLQSNPNLTKKSRDFYYSVEGFYSPQLHDQDTLNFELHNGSYRLFFFMPYDESFIIQEITIDGKSIDFSHFQGIVIEGKHNSTFKFNSYQPNAYVQSNFWLIRNSFCPNPTIYLYGNEKMEFGTSACTKLCIFSPSFDSKNNNFNVHFGITKEFGDRSSQLYTTNFDRPDKINNGKKAIDYKVEHAFFVQYHSQFYLNKSSKSASKKSNIPILKSDVSDSFIYSRKTKLNDIREKKCDVMFALRCKSTGCSLDFLNEYYWGCVNRGLPRLIIVCIVFAVIILITLICLGICCVVKRKKSSDLYNESILTSQNENMNSIPSNNYTETPNSYADEYMPNKYQYQQQNYNIQQSQYYPTQVPKNYYQ